MLKRTALFFMTAIIIMTQNAVFAQRPDYSIVESFKWRNIGPAQTSGRTVDIEAVESNPKVIWAAMATGGVWKSINAGTTWEPVFDDQPVASIGDLAIYQKNPDIVYVGTGEANNRNSSPWGGGVFKTVDGGKSWEFLGLKDTHHIGRVIIDPDNPDIVYVAAAGHLWGYNEERGLYKTTNGGKSWDKILYVDEKTGAIDVAMHPEDSRIVYAAMYERWHDAFDAGDPVIATGPGSGIFVSQDGGENWEKASIGLPSIDMGRIGLSVSRSEPDHVFAIIQTARGGGRGGGFGGGQSEPQEPETDRGGVFKSTDSGETWKIIGSYNNRPSYYSQIRVDPRNENLLWAAGINLSYSEDGGKTFSSSRKRTIHDDTHAIWIDPNDSDHIIAGTDGGIVITYDRGMSWDHIYQISTVQFYAITADMRKPYYVHGGLQDNGSWAGPSRNRSRWGIRNQDWFAIGGGDGFYSQVDPTNANIVYRESQNGNISRVDLSDGSSTSIRPTPENVINFDKYYPDFPQPQESRTPQTGGFGRNRGPFRFDWNSPILLSAYNPHTVYFGGNHLFKTIDQGETWSILSPDLTLHEVKNDNKRRAIVSIDESPLDPAVLWVGTNDGNVWLTKDNGASWSKLNNYISGAPKEYWVKRVEASNHVKSRAYIVFDGHRNDDQDPYIFMTDDFGMNWTKLSNDFPEGSVYVVREDYHNPNLLFAGTEFAIYTSLDRGQSWSRFMNNMPTVPVHDLYIHPREGDLIAGTHGRGAWIADNITPLQQLTNEIIAQDAHLFEIRPETKFARIYEWQFSTEKEFRAENPPTGSTIHYYLGEEANEAVLEITDISGEHSFSTLLSLSDENVTPGLHSVLWDFSYDPAPISGEMLDRAKTGIERIESEQERREMEDLLERYRRSVSRVEKVTLQRKLQPYMRARGRRGRGRFGQFGRADTAKPGTYMVKLTVDGIEMSTMLVIEKDNPGYMGK